MLHAIILTLAIISADFVETFFDFVGGIVTPTIAFLFPGVAYFIAISKFGQADSNKDS